MRNLAVLILVLLTASCTRSQQPAPPPPAAAFLITLGATDAEPARWDGSVEVTGAKVVALAGRRFTQEDAVQADGKSWKCATRRRAVIQPQHWRVGAKHVVPADVNAPAPPGPMIPNGVLLSLDSAARAEVRVNTSQGGFTFATDTLPFGRRGEFLGGRALVERAVAPSFLQHAGFQDDMPTVAFDAGGRPWVAWIGYGGGKDNVFASPLGEQPRGVGRPGVFFRTALARDSRHRLWVVTSAREGDTWNLAASRYDGRAWSTWELLTATPGPKLFHRLATDSTGRMWLVWQEWVQGKSVIQAKSYDGQVWSEIQTISDNASNAWEPAIAADGTGRVYFAWDAYDKGSYNIYLRVFDGRQLLPQRAVTTSHRFHAHASVAVDAQSRPWVAWDEAGPNWGKDTGFLIRKNAGEALYERRMIRIAVLDQDRWMTPELPFPGVEFDEQPQLVRDQAGRTWCFFRRRTTQMHEVYSPSLKANRLQQYSHWEYLAAAFDGRRWTTPVLLPHSAGRNDFRLAVAAAPDGRLFAAWSSDGRDWTRPYPPVKNGVVAGWVEAGGDVQTAPLRPFAEAPAPSAPVHPREEQQIAAIRKARITAAGRTYRIVRGDMHRHTDISFDGDIDGSIWDFYRYTIDAAGFEYSALTDHNSGDDDEYLWWVIQKSSDLFYVPDRFTPLYAYERSLRFPNGHRNILFARRGVRTLPRSKEEEAGTEGAAKLYQYLRKYGGLAMSHTSATVMGTDWRDNDPEVEPLVEIYQGDRMSYEYEGAPRAPRAAEKTTQPGGYAPEGFVWNAWAKGYRLGVQASSDHASTHVSYACLLVENTTRNGLLDAVRQRHAYAATDNIILDFQVNGRPMGDAFTAAGRAQITCRVTGTAPIAKVELIRNRQFIYTAAPNRESFEFSYEDKDARAGESYYYVRVQQVDGQMAWSSPVWVRTP
jgi:hypothetical protein